MIARAAAATLILFFVGSWQVVPRDQSGVGTGFTIRGRVVDPHGLKPEQAVLMLWSQRDNAGGSWGVPVPVGRDGSFVTHRLQPARYLLEVVRTPHSKTKPATVVGFTAVPIEADVSGVTVEIRRDTAIAGRFRMESDDPSAVWPPHIVINAFLAFDRTPLLNSTVADGAPAGRFVLRNAFGPRVIRAGYTLAPGHWWWPSRVTLDGVDITNVPVDFSEVEAGDLEVWFTQHPSRIRGVVTTIPGDPVEGAWVLAWPADQKTWQPWSSRSHVQRSDENGVYSLVTLPGEYLVRAVPPARLASGADVAAHFQDLAAGATPIELAAREAKYVVLRAGESLPYDAARRETGRRP